MSQFNELNGPPIRPEEQMLAIAEAEELAGLHLRQFRRALERGVIPQYGPHHSNKFIRRADVEAFLKGICKGGL
jgi:hypothetical protein